MDSKIFGKDIKDIPSCGDLDLRIARDGAWYYRHSPIGRKALVKLFASILHRDGKGDFWLVTPVERCKVEVEDAPFLAVDCRRSGKGEDATLDLYTNIEDWVEVGSSHPLYLKKGIPYVSMPRNLFAKINRPLYYELVNIAEEEDHHLVIWSRGQRYILGNFHETA